MRTTGEVGSAAITLASFTQDPAMCGSTICYWVEAVGRHDISFVSVATLEACDEHIVDVTLDGVSVPYELGDPNNPACANPHGIKVEQPIRRGDEVMLCIAYDRIYTFLDATTTFEVKAGRSCVTGEVAGAVSCFDGEVCDGFDNNCDGAVDEGFGGDVCEAGVGECRRVGETMCSPEDESVVCNAVPGEPSPDDQCDGLDNDCDASTDEHYVPRETVCGVGACARAGSLICAEGTEADTCVPGEPAASDPCNGIDDDCDGQTDEDFVSEATSCGVGMCVRSGATVCANGEVSDTCVPGTPAASDATCDGEDDDCDGHVDEDYAPQPTSCGVGECASTGVLVCMAGQLDDTCAPGTPTPDNQCDGLDNDCDGGSDDDYIPTATTCGTGACFAEGLLMCVDGSTMDSCAPGSPSAEVCNGVDDDCDGGVDEGMGQETCGVGLCARTVNQCVDGVPQVCQPGEPSAEVCNDLDDDCDGEVDEGLNPSFDVPLPVEPVGQGDITVLYYTVDPNTNTTEICYLVASDPSPNISHFVVGTIGTCDENLLAVTLDGMSVDAQVGDYWHEEQGCDPIHGVKFDVPVSTEVPVQVCLLYNGLFAFEEHAVPMQIKAGTDCTTGDVGGVTCEPANSCL